MIRPQRFFSQISRHFRREKRLSVGSFLVLLIILLLVDMFWLASVNISNQYQSVLKTAKVEIYIEDTFADSLLSFFKITLLQFEDVAYVDFTSREEAARILQNEFGPMILEGLEANPLPRSYTMSFYKSKSLADLDMFAHQIINLEGVSSVDFGREWIVKVENIGTGLKRIGLFVGGLILFVVLLTMANTNRLTARTKLQEFTQLKLLGAGPSYLLYPFLMEGFFSAVIAAGTGWLVIIYLLEQVSFTSFSLVVPTNTEIAIYCGVAGLTGMIGGYLGIRRFLRP
ncbi:MAG: permease-like cell division protein FtsX [candidate division Zixibacteria bacterium]|nr:permease-like cell division protein FtsX [candidate division Zixibacteria bacterium]